MWKRQDSEPAMISVNFSLLLCMSKVKYHWPKNAKGEKTVNPLCLRRSPHGVSNLRRIFQNVNSSNMGSAGEFTHVARLFLMF